MSDTDDPILDAIYTEVPSTDVTKVITDDDNLPITANTPKPPSVDWIDERDPAIIERDKNIDFAKNNIKDMMPTIADAASDTLSVAKMLSSADHAAAGSSLLGQYLAAQKALVSIEKTQDDLRQRDKKNGVSDEDGKPVVQNQTLNVFAGTTTELLTILDDLKKKGKA